MKLYGHPIATCTQRITFLLEELGVDYELVPIDLMKGEQKTPEYLEKQPFGKVPVLEDDDLTIFESRCIMRYLADKYADRVELWGRDAKVRALVDNWLEAEGHNYSVPVGALVYEKYFKSWRGEEADQAIIDKNVGLLNTVLDVYEKVLSKRDYIAGDKLSIADISHVPYTAYLIEKVGMKEPFESRPHVWAWWNRVTEREAWKKVWGACQ